LIGIASKHFVLLVIFSKSEKKRKDEQKEKDAGLHLTKMCNEVIHDRSFPM